MRNGGYRVRSGYHHVVPVESRLDLSDTGSIIEKSLTTATVHFDGPEMCSMGELAEPWDGTLEHSRRAEVRISEPEQVNCWKCRLFMKYPKNKEQNHG